MMRPVLVPLTRMACTVTQQREWLDPAEGQRQTNLISASADSLTRMSWEVAKNSGVNPAIRITAAHRNFLDS